MMATRSQVRPCGLRGPRVMAAIAKATASAARMYLASMAKCLAPQPPRAVDGSAGFIAIDRCLIVTSIDPYDASLDAVRSASAGGHVIGPDLYRLLGDQHA